MTEPTERLRRYGEDLSSAVSPARSRVAAMRAIGRAHQTRPRPTYRIAFASLGAFVLLNAGLAGVADAAVPGDTLYPIDRGYETVVDFVGLGGDRGEERIGEAKVLLERSDPKGAVELIVEATELESVEGAAAELEKLEGDDPHLPAHVHDLMAQVEALVDARRSGEADRRAEAEAAVNLVATQIRDQVVPGQVEDAGPPPHAQQPGPPDHAADPGPPDHAADPTGPPSSTPGRDEGPPADAGSPQDAGPASDGGPPADTPGNKGQSEPPASTPEAPPEDAGGQGRGQSGGRPSGSGHTGSENSGGSPSSAPGGGRP